MIKELLDLDVLRTFVLAVDLNSFAKAADQVFRSQSAVSLQMQRLEEMTGHKLFTKQGRSWHLTANGDLLLGYARQMLEINDQAMTILKATDATGYVRLGMRIDFSESGLAIVLARFISMYPKVQIEITIDREEVLLQKMQSGKLDIVVNFDKHVPDNAIVIGKIPLRWIGNKDKLIALQQPLPLLLFDAPCLFRESGLEALQKINRNWLPVLTASSITGIWAATKAGLGITIRTEIGLPTGCVALPMTIDLPALPEINIFILTSQKKSSAVVKHLIEVIQETLIEQLDEINRKQN